MEKKAPSSEATRPKAEASSSKVRTLGMECHFESTVAVGTTITGRPRTDPYVRVYAYGSYRG